MDKKMLALAVVFSTITCTSLAFAFDFETLDSKIQKGEVSRDQAKKIVDKAIKKGEITEDQLKEHMEQVRRRDMGKPDRDDFIKKLNEAGVTREDMDTAHQKGPEAVKQLLESHGIKAPEGGKPPFGPPPGCGDRKMPSKEEFLNKLKEAGISEKEFKSAEEKGPEAVKAFLDSKGFNPHKNFRHEDE